MRRCISRTISIGVVVLGAAVAMSCGGTPRDGTNAAVAASPVLPGATARPTEALAHPVVEGSAGPFTRARVTLTRRGPETGAPFTGRLEADGHTLTLAGPDLPADVFMVDPRAVLFTPLAATGPNGVVILYDSSQIGPGHGTDHLALVYRIERARAVRQPALEGRLAGAADAATARHRLRTRAR